MVKNFCWCCYLLSENLFGPSPDPQSVAHVQMHQQGKKKITVCPLASLIHFSLLSILYFHALVAFSSNMIPRLICLCSFSSRVQQRLCVLQDTPHAPSLNLYIPHKTVSKQTVQHFCEAIYGNNYRRFITHFTLWEKWKNK